MAGIIALCDFNENNAPEKLIYNTFKAMQLLQHRGKAYWKINSGKFEIEGAGSLPSFGVIWDRIKKKEKEITNVTIGYLSKKKPNSKKKQTGIRFSSDGFFFDIDKLSIHPLIKNKKNIDPLHQVYFIFRELLITRKDPYKTAEFLDRHLRGNFVAGINNKILVFRNSTGFKPMFIGESKQEKYFVTISENYVENFFNDLKMREINPGELISIDSKDGIIKIAQLDRNRILMDPFEFIRESHVSSIFNNKSIYSIRKNIGRAQAEFLLNKNIDTDTIFAEPDYTRPMALGFNR
ncbi:MAG: hypothetical protein M3162_03025, partial [Thermoproteota archaeon]|nr:hypothetical protein [Thermoproteota archaeon]